MSEATQRLIQQVQNANPGEIRERLHQEATRRGHAQQTAFAGVGGLLGGVLGSFRGPGGAAVGGLLGALLGALLGWRRDNATVQTMGRRLPTARPTELDVARSPVQPAVHARPRRVETQPEYIDVEYVDVCYRG